MRFSVCVIAKNESHTLPNRLLPSLREFLARGGEIIVVDTGSTDDTVRIAREAGCKVVEVGSRFVVPLSAELVRGINDRFTVLGDPEILKEGDALFDFAAARNFAASQASNDVVLIADCDESFERLDLDALDALIAEGKDRMDVDYVHSHDAAGRPLTHFRRNVLHNRRLSCWVGVVHEIIVGQTPYEPPTSVISLHHWQQPSTNRQSYLRGLAYDCYQHPEKDRQAHYFARELFYSGRYRSAIEMFEQHIAMPGAWKAEQAQSRLYIGDCWHALGDETRAVQAWFESNVMEGTRREPWMRLALHFHRKGDRHQAVACASAALALPRPGYYLDQLENYRNAPHDVLYTNLWYLGRRDEARHHFETARSLCPDNPAYTHDAIFFQDHKPLT